MELERNEARLSAEQQSLVLSYRHYARNLSYKYYYKARARGISAEDVESAANFGLCVSALRYRTKYGSKFSTYAYVRINGEVLDLLRGKHRGAVKTAEGAKDTLDLNESRHRLAATYDRYENEMGIKVHSALTKGVKSTEAEYAADQTPECVTAKLSARQLIDEALESLSPAEVYLIKQHYFMGKSIDAIQHDLGLSSRSVAFRLHRKALKELRFIFEKRGLEFGDFLSSLN